MFSFSRAWNLFTCDNLENSVGTTFPNCGLSLSFTIWPSDFWTIGEFSLLFSSHVDSLYIERTVFWRPVSSLYWATKLHLVNVEWNLKTFLSLLLPMPWWTPAFLLEKTLVPEGNLFFCPAPSFQHTAQGWWVVWRRSTKKSWWVCAESLCDWDS